MSYLLQKSKIITKKELNENSDKYMDYEKYNIQDHIILSNDDNPFFSLYDIALYCQKNYTKDKLFLLANRYIDETNNSKITEFYLFNTVDIFDKTLVSVLSMNLEELIDKQKVLQDNIELSKKLLNCNSLHIILGDNIMLHEVLEYIKKENSSIELFDNNIFSQAEEKIKYDTFETINSSRISSLIKDIRIIEPQNKKYKKYIFIFFIIVLSFLFAKDISDDLLYDMKSNETRAYKDLNKKLNQIKLKLQKQEKINKKLSINIKLLNKNKIYYKTQKDKK
jgi:hypothetical protein